MAIATEEVAFHTHVDIAAAAVLCGLFPVDSLSELVSVCWPQLTSYDPVLSALEI